MSRASSTKRSRRHNNASPPARKQPTSSTQPKTRSKISNQNSWIYAALFLATVAVYAQVQHFDFVNYDDPEYVTSNSHVLQGLTPQSLTWSITSGDAANWFPLTRISHMMDVQLFGLDSGLHHLTNLLFHVSATLLLFAFLNRATQARWPSAFVALIFALHPLHVESVAWIAERKDVLSAFFWALALWSYVRYAQRPERGRYLLVLLSFCMGLLAKPMIVTLPFVLLLLDFWPLRRLPARGKRGARVLWEKIPLFILSAAIAVVTYFVQRGSRAVKAFPLELRIENAVISYGTYIVKMFWPSNLAVFYPYPHEIPVWELLVIGVALVCISVLVLRALRSHPYLAVGWFWYLGTLLPVIGIIQVGAQARADRYAYIPMIGLSIILAWGAVDVIQRWPRSKPAVAILATAACGCCAVLSFIQIQYWRTSESLFDHALEVTQGSYVAHHNFGLAIVDQPGRCAEAVAHYRAALQIQPESVETRSDLGTALAKKGHFEEAIAEYQTALRIAPDCAICQSNLRLAETQMAEALFQQGVALEKSGQAQEAISQFEAALRRAPDYAEAHNDLGVALARLGRTAEAIREFKEAVRIKPDYEDARYNLAAALNQR